MLQHLALLKLVARTYADNIDRSLATTNYPMDLLALNKLVQREIFASHQKGRLHYVPLRLSNNKIVSLTIREYEIFLLLRYDSKNHYIANKLNISVRTVEVHIRNIKDKLGILYRGELVNFARVKARSYLIKFFT